MKKSKRGESLRNCECSLCT